MANPNLTATKDFHAFIDRLADGTTAIVEIYRIKGFQLGRRVQRFETASRGAKTRARQACRDLQRARR